MGLGKELFELSLAVATKKTAVNRALADSRVQNKEMTETLKKASLSALSVDDIRNVRGGKKREAAMCLSPTAPSENIDMMSFKNVMTGKTESKSKICIVVCPNDIV